MPQINYRGNANGGSAKRGDAVSVDGVTYIARRHTSEPPGPQSPDSWLPSVIKNDKAWNEMGPPGPPGNDGADGKDGRSIVGPKGADGSGFTLRGEWRRREYEPNDVVEHEGSTYVATTATRSEPGTRSSGWQLMAAKGERGRDGENGASQRGPRGHDGQTVIIENQSSVAAVFDSTASKGQAVYVSGDGHVDLASASSLTTAGVVGLAASNVAAGLAGIITDNGEIEIDDWSSVLGTQFLTPGLPVFLSETPGMLSHSPPTQAADICVVVVGRGLSATRLLAEVSTPIVQADLSP